MSLLSFKSWPGLTTPTRLGVKSSPSLATSEGVVECTSANAIDYLLQPKENDGPLHGVFIADDKPKKTGKEEESKVSGPCATILVRSDRPRSKLFSNDLARAALQHTKTRTSHTP